MGAEITGNYPVFSFSMNLEKCHTWCSFKNDSERFPFRDLSQSWYDLNNDNYSLKLCSLLAMCTMKSSLGLQEVWGGAEGGSYLAAPLAAFAESPPSDGCTLWVTAQGPEVAQGTCLELDSGTDAILKRKQKIFSFSCYAFKYIQKLHSYSQEFWAKKTGTTTTTPSICSWKQQLQQASFSLLWIYIRPEPPLIQSHWAPARAAVINILFHIIQVTFLSRASRNRHMTEE